MATYFYDSSIGETAPTLLDGVPIDQAAFTALQAENAALKTFRDVALADANARKAADAAKVDGQNLIDAAAGLP